MQHNGMKNLKDSCRLLGPCAATRLCSRVDDDWNRPWRYIGYDRLRAMITIMPHCRGEQTSTTGHHTGRRDVAIAVTHLWRDMSDGSLILILQNRYTRTDDGECSVGRVSVHSITGQTNAHRTARNDGGNNEGGSCACQARASAIERQSHQ